MMPFRPLSQFLAWIAICGTCLPTLAVEQNTEVRAAPLEGQRSPILRDVALRPGGMLIGEVLDNSMRPVADARVAIHVAGHPAAHTTTDVNGVFAVNGLRGGVHQVVAEDSMVNCRLWASGTAPPRAVTQLRFIPGQDDLVRGQWPTKTPYIAQAKSIATNPWFVGGVIAAAVAVPVAIHNIDDDDVE